MPCKIRVQAGGIELDYEGPEDFPIKDLPDLVHRILECGKSAGLGGTSGKHSTTGLARGTVAGATTSTIAGKRGCASGRDLVMAAAAKLHLVDGKLRFTRAELLSEMKSAATYYKSTYLNNLTGYVTRLVRAKKLNEISKDTYSLPEAVAQELRSNTA